jgi:hypothetical protein
VDRVITQGVDSFTVAAGDMTGEGEVGVNCYRVVSMQALLCGWAHSGGGGWVCLVTVVAGIGWGQAPGVQKVVWWGW